MGKVLDFTQKAATADTQEFVCELIKKLYHDIHFFNEAETEAEKERLGVAELDFLHSSIKQIKEQYHLTDEQFSDIIKSIDHKSLVYGVCSELMEKKS